MWNNDGNLQYSTGAHYPFEEEKRIVSPMEMGNAEQEQQNYVHPHYGSSPPLLYPYIFPSATYPNYLGSERRSAQDGVSPSFTEYSSSSALPYCSSDRRSAENVNVWWGNNVSSSLPQMKKDNVLYREAMERAPGPLLPAWMERKASRGDSSSTFSFPMNSQLLPATGCVCTSDDENEHGEEEEGKQRKGNEEIFTTKPTSRIISSTRSRSSGNTGVEKRRGGLLQEGNAFLFQEVPNHHQQSAAMLKESSEIPVLFPPYPSEKDSRPDSAAAQHPIIPSTITLDNVDNRHAGVYPLDLAPSKQPRDTLLRTEGIRRKEMGLLSFPSPPSLSPPLPSRQPVNRLAFWCHLAEVEHGLLQALLTCVNSGPNSSSSSLPWSPFFIDQKVQEEAEEKKKKGGERQDDGKGVADPLSSTCQINRRKCLTTNPPPPSLSSATGSVSASYSRDFAYHFFQKYLPPWIQQLMANVDALERLHREVKNLEVLQGDLQEYFFSSLPTSLPCTHRHITQTGKGTRSENGNFAPAEETVRQFLLQELLLTRSPVKYLPSSCGTASKGVFSSSSFPSSPSLSPSAGSASPPSVFLTSLPLPYPFLSSKVTHYSPSSATVGVKNFPSLSPSLLRPPFSGLPIASGQRSTTKNRGAPPRKGKRVKKEPLSHGVKGAGIKRFIICRGDERHSGEEEDEEEENNNSKNEIFMTFCPVPRFAVVTLYLLLLHQLQGLWFAVKREQQQQEQQQHPHHQNENEEAGEGTVVHQAGGHPHHLAHQAPSSFFSRLGVLNDHNAEDPMTTRKLNQLLEEANTHLHNIQKRLVEQHDLLSSGIKEQHHARQRLRQIVEEQEWKEKEERNKVTSVGTTPCCERNTSLTLPLPSSSVLLRHILHQLDSSSFTNSFGVSEWKNPLKKVGQEMPHAAGENNLKVDELHSERREGDTVTEKPYCMLSVRSSSCGSSSSSAYNNHNRGALPFPPQFLFDASLYPAPPQGISLTEGVSPLPFAWVNHKWSIPCRAGGGGGGSPSFGVAPVRALSSHSQRRSPPSCGFVGGTSSHAGATKEERHRNKKGATTKSSSTWLGGGRLSSLVGWLSSRGHDQSSRRISSKTNAYDYQEHQHEGRDRDLVRQDHSRIPKRKSKRGRERDSNSSKASKLRSCSSRMSAEREEKQLSSRHTKAFVELKRKKMKLDKKTFFSSTRTNRSSSSNARGKDCRASDRTSQSRSIANASSSSSSSTFSSIISVRGGKPRRGVGATYRDSPPSRSSHHLMEETTRSISLSPLDKQGEEESLKKKVNERNSILSHMFLFRKKEEGSCHEEVISKAKQGSPTRRTSSVSLRASRHGKPCRGSAGAAASPPHLEYFSNDVSLSISPSENTANRNSIKKWKRKNVERKTAGKDLFSSVSLKKESRALTSSNEGKLNVSHHINRKRSSLSRSPEPASSDGNPCSVQEDTSVKERQGKDRIYKEKRMEEVAERKIPREYSLRSGFPLWKAIPAFFKAVTAQAFDFSDEDEKTEEHHLHPTQ